MKGKVLSCLRKRRWQKNLAAAIALGLITGYAPCVWAQAINADNLGAADYAITENGAYAADEDNKVAIFVGRTIANINYADGVTKGNTVKIDGDVMLGFGQPDGKSPLSNASNINLALDTPDSYLKGVIHNSYSGGNVPTTYTAAANLWLSNGAKWVNYLSDSTSFDDYYNKPFKEQGKAESAFNRSVVQSFTGGSSAGNAGYIIQKDTGPVLIMNYTGNSVVVYDSSEYDSKNGFSAGNVMIASATPGSVITLATDSGSFTSGDYVTVLEHLAQELYYMDSGYGLTNLTGYVKIASGLTCSDITNIELKDDNVKKWGEIEFVAANQGFGSLKADSVADGDGVGDDGGNGDDSGNGGDSGDGGNTGGTGTYNVAITGTRADDTSFKGVVTTVSGVRTYKFNGDATLDIDETTGVDVGNSRLGAIRTTKADDKYNIDASGHTLNIKTTTNEKSMYTARFSGGSTCPVTITADEINIIGVSNYEENASIGGLSGFCSEEKSNVTVNGDVNVSLTGKNPYVLYGLGTWTGGDLTLNGDVTIDLQSENQKGTRHIAGLYSDALNSSDYSTITVNGDYTFVGSDNNGVNGNGVFINGNGIINLNGDTTIKLFEKDKSGMAAVRNGGGTVNINVNSGADGVVTGAANNEVKIDGDIFLNTDFANPSFENIGRKTVVNLGLDTQNSHLNGVVYNSFCNNGNWGELVLTMYTSSGSKDVLFEADANMWLSNGATWTNETYNTNSSVGFESLEYFATAFDGSRVTNFVGGANDDKAGKIIQKDSNPIHIDNYSGHTVVVYDYDDFDTKKGFKAGAVKINTAKGNKADNVITLATEYANDMVNIGFNTVLDKLANELYYLGYKDGKEDKLTGMVQIASGLTSNSVTKEVKATDDVIFSTTTGQGSIYESGGNTSDDDNNDDNTDTDELIGTSGIFTTGLKGNVDLDSATLGTDAVGEAADGTIKYKFNGDSAINVGNATAAVFNSGKYIIDAVGANNANHTLSLNADSDDVSNAPNCTALSIGGEYANRAAEVVINGDLAVSAHGDSWVAQGILVGADSKFTLNGDLTINGITAANNYGGYGEGGTASAGAPNYKGARWSPFGIRAFTLANVDINGDVDLKVSGTAVETDPWRVVNGKADKDLAIINLNGGNVKILTPVDSNETYYALANYGGTINVNVKDKNIANSGNEVYMEGNVITMAENDGSGGVEFYRDGVTNIGLNSSNSVWHGVIDNSGSGQAGEVNVWVQNGAVWNHKAMSKTNGLDATNMPSPSIEHYGKYDNVSHVFNLVGGKDAASAGTIWQNDAAKLKISNLSGHTNIIYTHENDGSKASDYVGGDTIVTHSDNATLTLKTNNNGINMNDAASVNAALSGLASKLVYENYTKGEKRLDAMVEIASGLTAPALKSQIEMRTMLAGSANTTNDTVPAKGYINFDSQGQASFTPGNQSAFDPSSPSFPVLSKNDTDSGNGGNNGGNNDGDNGGNIIIGDAETYMMKGARSAMTTSMLAWRDNASDIDYRVRGLRDGEERGTWAEVYGGKTKYNGSGISASNSYWAGAVGFDRELHGWTVGAMVNYQTGDSNYLLGGEGDNEMYSAGIYGTTEIGNKVYLDVSAKVGRVQNEYSVYNEIGQELKGDYAARGYGLSAQISKRFGNEKRYFEPQVQFTLAKVDSNDYNAYSGKNVMHIEQDSFNSMVGRIGFETGIKQEKGNFFARLSLAHEFDGDISGSYMADDGGLKSTKYDVADTWSEITLGGSYNMSKTSNFYLDVTRSLTGDYEHEWKLNAGVNFTF